MARTNSNGLYIVPKPAEPCARCGKVAAPDSAYCPRCALLIAETPEDIRRKEEALARQREFRDRQRVALAVSPLAVAADSGCEWMSKSKDVTTRCHKVCLDGSSYCPRHAALADESLKKRELKQQERQRVVICRKHK